MEEHPPDTCLSCALPVCTETVPGGGGVAVLVHRTYADRVAHALLQPHCGLDVGSSLSSSSWRGIDDPPPSFGAEGGWGVSSEKGIDKGKSSSSPPVPSVRDCVDGGSVVSIPTPFERGARKGRRGYSLLVVLRGSGGEDGGREFCKATADLPAMARMQISWAGGICRRTCLLDGRARSDGSPEDCGDCVEGEILREIGKGALRDLRALRGWVDIKCEAARETIRVDVQPKCPERLVDVCRALQRAATADSEATPRAKMNGEEDLAAAKGGKDGNKADEDDDPFECGPLDFTASASRCSVVLVVVRSSPAEWYWGVSSPERHFVKLNGRLNDNARGEVRVGPTDSITGEDITGPNDNAAKGGSGDASPPDATPLSRAYYKLDQVFSDNGVLGPYRSRLLSCWGSSSGGPISGLDLGASPGGWTQVLHSRLFHSLHPSDVTMVSVDPAVLARRVRSLPGVVHVRSDLSSSKTITELASHAPYTAVVCDASEDGHRVLTKVRVCLESIARVKCEKNGGIGGGRVLRLPALFVLTLKLPHKTKDSIGRNLEKISATVPGELRRISSLISSCPLSVGDKYHSVDCGGDYSVHYRIVHLMANSESERTLIAVFGGER